MSLITASQGKIEISFYKSKGDKCPYSEWFTTLESDAKNAVRVQIDKITDGRLYVLKKLSNCKDLFEIRVMVKPGYRIYCTVYNNEVVILCAGKKDTQNRDIEKAMVYLKSLKEAL